MRDPFDNDVIFNKRLPLSRLVSISEDAPMTDPKDETNGVTGLAKETAKGRIHIDYNILFEVFYEEASR
ncbi:Heterokaryon incompatibility protein 6, OR allele 4 [Colletotrichum musicola]|uniref:Heterokaryon incompatibility protein 6, OR allele 4 n=1 Tax=Colletotrichum musicola TaxID=2175873 RepID=A0A8H6IUS0_9PEZI|nr:Heterokaryon incompatibility protein 6, OR allele 4 [Colletotrichum musicola]